MNKGIDKLFDLPMIGPLFQLLFSERTHVALAVTFSLGGVCWLINLLVESPQFNTIALYLMKIPLLLFAIWIIFVLLFLLIEKRSFPDSGSGRGMSEKTIDREIKRAEEAGKLELSIRFNSSEVGFSKSSLVLTLKVTGGQDDHVDEEVAAFLSARTEKKIRVEKGKNRWRRLIYFE